MTKSFDKAPISIVSVPVDLGAKNLGVDIGPDAFMRSGLVEKLTRAGLKIHDDQTVAVADRDSLKPGDSRLKYLDEILRVSEESAKLAATAVKAGRRVVGLGGDHSMNLGLVSGVSAALEGELGMIYFDAHGDICTAEITMSGNIHGMHVAGLLGYEPALANVHTNKVKIQPANLLHIGGSDFDAPEWEFIENKGLNFFTLLDILRQGLGPAFDKIDALVSRVPNIYVSLDLDVIDQVYAPGAGMPNAKGLLYREIATIAEYIGTNANVVAVDVVEYNPLQDENGKTGDLGIELIAKFFGSDYSWYTEYMERNQVS